MKDLRGVEQCRAAEICSGLPISIRTISVYCSMAALCPFPPTTNHQQTARLCRLTTLVFCSAPDRRNADDLVDFPPIATRYLLCLGRPPPLLPPRWPLFVNFFLDLLPHLHGGQLSINSLCLKVFPRPQGCEI